MKKILLILLSFWLTVGFSEDDYDDDHIPIIRLPELTNLQADLKLAAKNNQALVIMFSADNCPFCEILASEVLRPMQIVQAGSNYIIRRVEMDIDSTIIDFDGSKINTVDFSERYSIPVTPTLLFFDHKGIENAERIIGINGVELVGYYVDNSIKLISQKIAKVTK